MEEIKVGSIVYSPDYGRGRVAELDTLLGYKVAMVGFSGREHTMAINIDNLSTTKPADELDKLRAEVGRLNQRAKELEAERDEFEGEIAELLDYAERGGGAYEQDGFSGYSEKARQVFETLKVLREDSMASAFLSEELTRLETTLKEIKECRTITAIDELVSKALRNA